ncbi:F-box DNA helicase 1-like [Procambarus clarkii]|uniref:F-box DNA helicase 1-like n=1 Tax=Procambarus clarkii TaxID=6728 RepID=UPI003742BDA5
MDENEKVSEPGWLAIQLQKERALQLLATREGNLQLNPVTCRVSVEGDEQVLGEAANPHDTDVMYSIDINVAVRTLVTAVCCQQDGVVKAWQLTKPRIQGYDVLLVDGAEDASVAMLDILLRQHFAKVFVGDSYQHLGPSRGTVSAFDKVTPTHKFYLSQSFRFGPEVSYAAQCVLESVYGVCNRTVVGSRIKDSFVHTPDPRVFDPNSKLKRAYIAKSNFELYKIATEICEDCEYIAASMTFAGGMSKYGYDDVMDIYNLYLIQEGLATRETVNIQNPLVAKFETIASLTTFAKSVEDQDLHSKIMMFHYSGSRTPNHVTLLTQRCGTAASEADITFSTIGMAKGLEWDWVILKDDAPIDTIGLSPNRRLRRLLYVSLTRAKKFLTINSDVLYAILLARDQLQVFMGYRLWIKIENKIAPRLMLITGKLHLPGSTLYHQLKMVQVIN